MEEESGVVSRESENVINMVGSEQSMKFGASNDTGAFGKIMFSYLCGVLVWRRYFRMERKCENVEMWK